MFRKRFNVANLKNVQSADSWNALRDQRKGETAKYLKKSKVIRPRKLFALILLAAGCFAGLLIKWRQHSVQYSVVFFRKQSTRTKPLLIGCYFNKNASETPLILKVRSLQVYDEENRYPSKRQVEWTARDESFQTQLRDSKKYKREMPQQRDTRECKLPFNWQRKYIPTCNCIHEHDFTGFYRESSTVVEENIRLIASGFWRDVWKIQDLGLPGTWIAAKTLRTVHPYTARNLDRHRRDALATERTSSSPFTMNMFAFCGHTVLMEYSHEGSLSDVIWPINGNCTLSAKQRFQYAVEAAKGLVDLQYADRPDAATISHTDITPSQFVVLNGTLKLNDFNRARFITFDERNGKACAFRVGMNPGKYRSPEEYAYEDETEKIDVYAIGNVFYSLLTESWPYHELPEEEAQDRIRKGEHPDLSMFVNTTNPYEKILVEATIWSWTKDPK